ncbi:MAG: hypothetical protein ACE37F_33360 [Nannocystaceae bacterium]|nr:hypothetical protein [bacterium]
MVSRRLALRCLIALGLGVPRVANAEPAADAPAEAAPTDDAQPGTAETEEEPEPATEDEPEDEPAAEPSGEADDDEPDDDEPDDDEPDDEIYAEGVEEADLAPSNPLPDRLPRLQRIGWYHVLGAFTLGTTAGLLAGLAEREEDRATRIASGYDFETGAAILYRDRQARYEEILDRGQALETSAIVVGALAGATAIAAITLFAIDARRKAPSATARRARVGPGSLEVSF